MCRWQPRRQTPAMPWQNGEFEMDARREVDRSGADAHSQRATGNATALQLRPSTDSAIFGAPAPTGPFGRVPGSWPSPETRTNEDSFIKSLWCPTRHASVAADVYSSDVAEAHFHQAPRELAT